LRTLGLLLEAASTALGNLVFRHPGNQARAAINGTLSVLVRVLGGHFLSPALLDAAVPGSGLEARVRGLVRDVSEVEGKLDIDDAVRGVLGQDSGALQLFFVPVFPRSCVAF
jgi:hypothetical protein